MTTDYTPGLVPTPEQVRTAREAAGLTQEQATELLYITTRAWQNYEAQEGTQNHRPMPADRFELFLLKTGLMRMSEVAV